MNKHGCGEWEHFALYGHEEILIKIYEIPCQNLKWSHKIVPCVTLLKNCSRNCEQWKNMGAGGGGGGGGSGGGSGGGGGKRLFALCGLQRNSCQTSK